jgi:hypothetical protein
MRKEIWKFVDGYLNLYSVSNFGSVKRNDGCVLRGKSKVFVKGRVLSLKKHRDGYLNVNLSINGSQKTEGIHRLVAKAFIPNPKNKPDVNHIDGNKLNNCVENLEWATKSENSKHAWDSGLLSRDNILKNRKKKFFVSNEMIEIIKKEYVPYYNSAKKLSEKYKLKYSAVVNVLNGNYEINQSAK